MLSARTTLMYTNDLTICRRVLLNVTTYGVFVIQIIISVMDMGHETLLNTRPSFKAWQRLNGIRLNESIHRNNKATVMIEKSNQCAVCLLLHCRCKAHAETYLRNMCADKQTCIYVCITQLHYFLLIACRMSHISFNCSPLLYFGLPSLPASQITNNSISLIATNVNAYTQRNTSSCKQNKTQSKSFRRWTIAKHRLNALSAVAIVRFIRFRSSFFHSFFFC